MPIRDEGPQGSVLGPILYTLFTADLPIIPSRYLTAATYADDTAFLATATNLQRASAIIQRKLDALDPDPLRAPTSTESVSRPTYA